VPTRPAPPSRPRVPLSRDRILDAAHRLVEEEGWHRLSMRKLAAALQVDPMAPYHHFANREALLQALVARVFSPLAEPGPRPSAHLPWQAALLALVERYLDLALGAPEVIRALARGEGDASFPVRAFDRALAEILAPLHLSKVHLRTATDLVVDMMHGVALAGGPLRRSALKAEVAMLAKGVEACARITPGAGPRGSAARVRVPGR